MTTLTRAFAVCAILVIGGSIWLTPWVGFLFFLCAAVYFLLMARRQERDVRELLRDPAAQSFAFDELTTHLREKLKAGEQNLRDRDAEIAQRRQITNAIPDGLFLLDRENRIVWCNQSALVMHKLDAFRDMGKPIGQLIRAPEFLNYLQEPSSLEPVIAIDSRTLSFRLEILRDDSRLLLTRDVTDRERLDRMRRDFVANVSHELRTPLTVMSGYLETIRDLPLPETDRTRYIGLIETQTTNMQRLVADLLTLARLENEQIPSEAVPVDVGAVLRDAYEDASALSAGSHTLTLDAPLGIDMRGSPTELRTALTNLLSNAVRYTPPGGEISASVRRVSGAVVVEVRDTGLGIAPEHLPRLTERFYRVDRSRSRDTGGTGLGLAIVKHVLQRHRGRLEVDSELGKGSTFRLRFSQGDNETT